MSARTMQIPGCNPVTSYEWIWVAVLSIKATEVNYAENYQPNYRKPDK